MLALVVGAGFLVALRGTHAGGGSPAAPGPKVRRGAFPGAPRPSHSHFTTQGLYVCREAPRNRYLPRNAGCVSVRRVDMTGGRTPDLVLIYADLGSHRVPAGIEPTGFTLEVVRPGGSITRTQVRADPFPSIMRVGNLNGVPGDELVLHLDDISSGDTYGIYTFSGDRLRQVATPSAGGDSATKAGFQCRVGVRVRPRLVEYGVSLIGPTIYGRWRWTVTTYAWRGATLQRLAARTFVRRGLPSAASTAAGSGCGRPLSGGVR